MTAAAWPIGDGAPLDLSRYADGRLTATVWGAAWQHSEPGDRERLREQLRIHACRALVAYADTLQVVLLGPPAVVIRERIDGSGLAWDLASASAPAEGRAQLAQLPL